MLLLIHLNYIVLLHLWILNFFILRILRLYYLWLSWILFILNNLITFSYFDSIQSSYLGIFFKIRYFTVSCCLVKFIYRLFVLSLLSRYNILCIAKNFTDENNHVVRHLLSIIFHLLLSPRNIVSIKWKYVFFQFNSIYIWVEFWIIKRCSRNYISFIILIWKLLHIFSDYAPDRSLGKDFYHFIIMTKTEIMQNVSKN